MSSLLANDIADLGSTTGLSTLTLGRRSFTFCGKRFEAVENGDIVGLARYDNKVMS